jgi:hypothetical protein
VRGLSSMPRRAPAFPLPGSGARPVSVVRAELAEQLSPFKQIVGAWRQYSFAGIP